MAYNNLNDQILIAMRVLASGAIDYLIDNTGLLSRVTRLQAGVYQIDFKRGVSAREVYPSDDPISFDAAPPDFSATPMLFRSYLGGPALITGLFIITGTVGVGVVDHDFYVRLDNVRVGT